MTTSALQRIKLTAPAVVRSNLIIPMCRHGALSLGLHDGRFRVVGMANAAESQGAGQ